MRSSKGLTSYPIFLLTLASIIALTMLTLHLMNTAVEEVRREADSPNIFIKYAIVNNSVYIQTTADPPINETIVANSGAFTITLNQVGQYYGPLLLPNYESMIAITGYADGQPRIIDVLKSMPGPKIIMAKINELFPPSLIINTSTLSIQQISQSNPNTTYYVMKPLITSRKLRVNNNTSYTINEYGDIEETGTSKWVNLGQVPGDNNLSATTWRYIESYGRIKLKAKIPLTLKLEQEYTRNTELRAAYNSSTTPPVIVGVNIPIGTINTSEWKTIHLSLIIGFQSLSLFDRYGNRYKFDAKMETLLKALVSTNNTSHIIYSSIKDIGGNTSGQLNLRKAFITNAETELSLYIKFTITPTENPITTPLMGTVSILIKPGYNNEVYAEQYKPDMIKLILSNREKFYVVPLQQQVVNASITGSLAENTLTLWLNNTVMKVLEAIYDPVYNTSISYELQVYPSIIISNTTNTFITASPRILEYKISSGIGLYINQESTDIEITTYPLIRYTFLNYTGEYVIRDPESSVIMVNKSGSLTLYIENTRDSFLVEADDASLYNLLISEDLKIRKPVVILEGHTGLQFNITVTFVDNTSELYTSEGGTILVENKPIKMVEIEALCYGKEIIVYKTFHGGIMVRDTARNSIQILNSEGLSRATVLGRSVYIVETMNNTLIIP